MASICTDHHHHHKLHHHLLSSATKKPAHHHHLQDLVLNSNIPPRKLISHHSSSTDSDDDGVVGAAYDAETDPYSSDPFRMFEFKIRRCTRSRSHDWTDCPFAHPGEKARRRDPRKFHYSGAVCPDFRRAGSCARGDECDFAHGVFEVWLHPSRYRTEACKDGKNCKRKVCFFAHSPRELRVLPSDAADEGGVGCGSHLLSLGDIMMMRSAGNGTSSGAGGGGGGNNNNNHCCKHCTCSPRSTLAAPLSPPSPAERFAWANHANHHHHPAALAPLDELAYEDALGELMSNLEVMSFKEANFPGPGGGGPHNGGLWVDVVGDHGGGGGGGGDEPQFVLSPSAPMNSTPLSANSRGYNMTGVYGGGGVGGGGGGGFDSPCSSGIGSYSFDSPVSYKGNLEVEEVSKAGLGDPDLGWVNDLLM